MKGFLFAVIFIGFSLSNAFAQSTTKTYTTKFVPHSVTYNGSDNPNECWESVAWGILIEDGKNNYFFEMPFQELEELKEKIGDGEIIVEVGFHDEPYSDTGEDGWVKKITLNGVIIFEN